MPMQMVPPPAPEMADDAPDLELEQVRREHARVIDDLRVVKERRRVQAARQWPAVERRLRERRRP